MAIFFSDAACNNCYSLAGRRARKSSIFSWLSECLNFDREGSE